MSFGLHTKAPSLKGGAIRDKIGRKLTEGFASGDLRFCDPEKSSLTITRGVRVGSDVIGGSTIAWIVSNGFDQSESLLVQHVATLRDIGVKFVRARIQPGGVGAKGAIEEDCNEFTLKTVCDAAKLFGLHVVAEVCDTRSLETIARYSDVIEVRPKNSRNIELLKMLGELDKTVILHRGMMTLDELFASLEALEKGGESQIMLAENGLCRFDSGFTQLLDLSALVRLKRETPYPVFVDCSTAAIDISYAESLVIAAVAAGADGMMIEMELGARKTRAKGASTIDQGQLVSMIKKTEAVKYTLNALLHKDFEQRLGRAKQ